MWNMNKGIYMEWWHATQVSRKTLLPCFTVTIASSLSLVPIRDHVRAHSGPLGIMAEPQSVRTNMEGMFGLLDLCWLKYYSISVSMVTLCAMAKTLSFSSIVVVVAEVIVEIKNIQQPTMLLHELIQIQIRIENFRTKLCSGQNGRLPHERVHHKGFRIYLL